MSEIKKIRKLFLIGCVGFLVLGLLADLLQIELVPRFMLGVGAGFGCSWAILYGQEQGKDEVDGN